ncbi:MAG: alpha/beta fold hydrolase [Trichloromonadaceae bacterium]
MKKMKIKGVPMSYDERGRGPAVVLLQGLEEREELWQEESHSLEKAGFRVIRLDLRPHLATATNLAGNLSEQVIALLNQLGVGRAVFIGWSKGGQILQDLAKRFPRRVAKSIDLTTSGHSQPNAPGKRLVDVLQGLRLGTLPMA